MTGTHSVTNEFSERMFICYDDTRHAGMLDVRTEHRSYICIYVWVMYIYMYISTVDIVTSEPIRFVSCLVMFQRLITQSWSHQGGIERQNPFEEENAQLVCYERIHSLSTPFHRST